MIGLGEKQGEVIMSYNVAKALISRARIEADRLDCVAGKMPDGPDKRVIQDEATHWRMMAGAAAEELQKLENKVAV